MKKTLLLVVCALMLAPLPGRADTRRVSMTGNKFVPPVRTGLAAGDEIDFSFLDGTHHVVALQNGEFDSGVVTSEDDFVTTYTGGIVRYRCTIHSRLKNGFECEGMCGVLTDRALETVPPGVTIESPGALVPPPVPPSGVATTVTLRGTATDDTAVWGVMARVYGTTGVATEYMAACVACDTTAATWSIDLALQPGSYVAEAIAVDSSGNVPTTFPRVSFIVL
jgi:plastocyanin